MGVCFQPSYMLLPQDNDSNPSPLPWDNSLGKTGQRAGVIASHKRRAILHCEIGRQLSETTTLLSLSIFVFDKANLDLFIVVKLPFLQKKKSPFNILNMSEVSTSVQKLPVSRPRK